MSWPAGGPRPATCVLSSAVDGLPSRTDIYDRRGLRGLVQQPNNRGVLTGSLRFERENCSSVRATSVLSAQTCSSIFLRVDARCCSWIDDDGINSSLFCVVPAALWMRMRSTRRAPDRSACSLSSMDDQPDASTAATRVNLRCKRSLIARVSGASSNRSRSLPRSRPSRAQRVCVPQVRDPTLRTGREGGIEMLNIEGRAPARPWPACRSVTVKPSSKRSRNLYMYM